MAHAETCPICWGKGKLQESGSTAVMDKTCQGCDGKGWVSVQDEVVTWPVYPQLPYPWQTITPSWWNTSGMAVLNG